jgi:hypothetical protein
MLTQPKIRDFLQNTHGIGMGTRDASMKPDYARVLGIEIVDDEHLCFFIDKDSNVRSLQNLEDNKAISLVLVKMTYECYQFKGTCVRVQKGTEEEVQTVQNYLKAFNNEVIPIGIEDGVIYNYPHGNMYSVLMEVQEIYEQTPKPGTGRKV